MNDELMVKIRSWLEKNVGDFHEEVVAGGFEALGCRYLKLGDYAVMLDWEETDQEEPDDEPYCMIASIRKVDSSYFAWDWLMPCSPDGGVYCWCSTWPQPDYTSEAKWLTDWLNEFTNQNSNKDETSM